MNALEDKGSNFSPTLYCWSEVDTTQAHVPAQGVWVQVKQGMSTCFESGFLLLKVKRLEPCGLRG